MLRQSQFGSLRILRFILIAAQPLFKLPCAQNRCSLISGLGEPILSVGLCAPRSDVFDPAVAYLLVVCTPSVVRVFAASFEVSGRDGVVRVFALS